MAMDEFNMDDYEKEILNKIKEEGIDSVTEEETMELHSRALNKVLEMSQKWDGDSLDDRVMRAMIGMAIPIYNITGEINPEEISQINPMIWSYFTQMLDNVANHMKSMLMMTALKELQ